MDIKNRMHLIVFLMIYFVNYIKIYSAKKFFRRRKPCIYPKWILDLKRLNMRIILFYTYVFLLDVSYIDLKLKPKYTTLIMC